MYPELGITGEALSPLEAIAKLEEARVSTILGKLERGEPVPVPRPPLREEIGGLDAQKLGFAKWLVDRSEEHTSELQSLTNLVCRLLLEKKKKKKKQKIIKIQIIIT